MFKLNVYAGGDFYKLFSAVATLELAELGVRNLAQDMGVDEVIEVKTSEEIPDYVWMTIEVHDLELGHVVRWWYFPPVGDFYFNPD